MGDVERLIKIEAIKGLSVYDICDLLDELDRVAKVHNLKMQSLESEIERLKKENEVLRIMDESYKLNWSNDRDIINKKDEEISSLVLLLDRFCVKSNGLSMKLRGFGLTDKEVMKKIKDLYDFQCEVETGALSYYK